MWFVSNLERLDAEMAALKVLSSEGWIDQAEWQVERESGTLRVKLDFRVGEKVYEAWLSYPHVFPWAPPQIVPRREGELWSGHQWGVGGELCLQIRSDNWSPLCTGADMVRSARSLLLTECASDEKGHRRTAPSAHVLSEGQQMLWQFRRLVVMPAFLNKLMEQPAGCRCRLAISFSENAMIYTPATLMLADGTEWADPSVPASFRGRAFTNGYAFPLATDDANASLAKRPDALTATELWSQFSVEPLTEDMVLFLALPEEVYCHYLDAKKDTVSKVGMLKQEYAARLSPSNAILASKRIGLIGAGSMGSKVAASIARAGARKFLVIDDDLLTDGNLVRHDLDWNSVGAHKAEAIKKRLELIAPGIDVQVLRMKLGGQTSTKLLLSALSNLGTCDLIVDASGSADGLNYAAAAAENYGIPMVWGSVFAGGYGGYIARSRPRVDPGPFAARTEISNWCANPEFPEPPAAAEIDYGAGKEGQPPMIADDADVSVIASHLAKFAIDLLVKPDSSSYPYSAYMIGLRAEWIFTEPFSTFPIPFTGGSSNTSSSLPLPVGEFGKIARQYMRIMS